MSEPRSTVTLPSDAFELLATQLGAICNSFALETWDLLHDGRWEVRWSTEFYDSSDSGDVLAADLTGALLTATSRIASTLPKSFSLTIPDPETLAAAERYQDLIAIRRRMKVLRVSRTFGGARAADDVAQSADGALYAHLWCVASECSSLDVSVDRSGSIARRSLGDAIREAFDRTCGDALSRLTRPLPAAVAIPE